MINFFKYTKHYIYLYFVIYQYLKILQKMSENGLSSSTILDCSVAVNDVADNMMDSVKVGLKYGELCYTLSDGCNKK